MSGKSLSELYVLLVEPSSSQTKYILKELAKAGIVNYDAVADGTSALAKMHMMKPDLVISSMHFADMTGSDLIRKMRKDERLESVAFMLVSSETGFEYIDAVKQAGASAILPKPFSYSQLKRALFNTLEMLNPDALTFDDFSPEELRVLVVDDSKMARNHVKRVLNGLGIEHITEADDGATAVPLLETSFFDFVVTDYNMPQMDGKELIEFIRNKSSQRSMPVLMVTSEDNAGNLAAVEQAGVSGICDKPFETDTVREIIRAIMTEVE